MQSSRLWESDVLLSFHLTSTHFSKRSTRASSFHPRSRLFPTLTRFPAFFRLSSQRGSYEALRSEAWDRGSYDQWGFGLTPFTGLDRVASGTRSHTCTRIQTWFFTRSLFISSFVFSFGSSRESLTVCLPFETRWFIATHAEHSTTPPSRVDGDSSDSCGHVGTKLSLRYSRLSGEMLVEDVWRGLMAA